jgi:hypothetical protein
MKVIHERERFTFSPGFYDRQARLNRVSDRATARGTEHRHRISSKCLTRTSEAAQPVGSTIRELDWTADDNSFATPWMLLSGTRQFKHAENDPDEECFDGSPRRTTCNVVGLNDSNHGVKHSKDQKPALRIMLLLPDCTDQTSVGDAVGDLRLDQFQL